MLLLIGMISGSIVYYNLTKLIFESKNKLMPILGMICFIIFTICCSIDNLDNGKKSQAKAELTDSKPRYKALYKDQPDGTRSIEVEEVAADK